MNLSLRKNRRELTIYQKNQILTKVLLINIYSYEKSIIYIIFLLIIFTSKAQTIYSGKIVADHGALIIGTTLIKTPRPFTDGKERNANCVYYSYPPDLGVYNKVSYSEFSGCYGEDNSYIVPEWVTAIAANAVTGARGYSYSERILLYIKRGANMRIAEGAFDDLVEIRFYDNTDDDLTKIPEAVNIEEEQTNNSTGKLYNIQGMEITEPQEGQIYILDGQKYLKIGE